MSIRRDFPDLPPVWALGVVAAQWAAARWLPLVRLDASWAVPLGWAALAAGLGLIGWAALWFRRRRTSIEPGEVPSALIVEGPFRLNRNPIYTGMTACLLGTGLLFGALAAVLLAAAFPALITARFVRAEEAALRAAFGPEAEAYIARSRRW